MNETKTALASDRSSWIVDIRNWIFSSNVHVNESEDYASKAIFMRLLGGLIKTGAVIFTDLNLNGITTKIGLGRFHIDLDLFYIPRPELEVQRDRIPNIFSINKEGVNYLTWFFGYEGVGIYRKKSLHDGYGVSKIDIGAHPMTSVGFANLYAPHTQHAILGLQVMNLQVSVHSAIDTKDVVG